MSHPAPDPTPDSAPMSEPAPPAINAFPLRQSTEIQGNILAGFNKDHQAFLFLQFPDQHNAQGWLNELVKDDPPRLSMTNHVVEFNQRSSEARRSRGGDDPPKLLAHWVNVSLTYHGLLKLAPNLESDLRSLTAFREGPVARASLLGDSDEHSRPETWLFGGSGGQEIHALLTVAADDRDDFRVQFDKQRDLPAYYRLMVVFEQRGQTLPGPRHGHEHFGFKDGISQPGVHDFDFVQINGEGEEEKKDHPGTEMIEAGEFVIGYRREDGTTRTNP